ncbi:MAG: Gfo/Idh/MocA family oxidoreductase, partial [Candidatus Omnitrophota bacterium]
MLKVAVTGCGLISTKNHIPTFLKAADKVKIVAVCDLNEEAVKNVAKKFNIPGVYTDFSDMLKKEKPDILDICTPPQTHAKLAVEALKSGCDVLLEKPMALKLEDCEAIVACANENKKQVCVVHNQIFNPAFLKAKAMLDKGEIGDFVGMDIFLSTPTDYITSKENHWAHKLPGGILGETGPHPAYLASAFLNDIYEAKVEARKFLNQYPWSIGEDFRINLLAKNGFCSTVLFYGSNQWAADLSIYGTEGYLRIDLQAQTVVKYKRPALKSSCMAKSVFSCAFQMLGGIFSAAARYSLKKNYNAHEIGIKMFIDSLVKGEKTPVTA